MNSKVVHCGYIISSALVHQMKHIFPSHTLYFMSHLVFSVEKKKMVLLSTSFSKYDLDYSNPEYTYKSVKVLS